MTQFDNSIFIKHANKNKHQCTKEIQNSIQNDS